MTDDAINRLVAEHVMGWKPYDTGEVWTHLSLSGQWLFTGWAITPPDFDKDYEISSETCAWELTNPVYRFGGSCVFDVCGDPVAWGQVWDYITAQGWHVALDTFADRATATVRHVPTDRSATVNDDKKGRALALAALRAHGVAP
jgi:hypothetical protein